MSEDNRPIYVIIRDLWRTLSDRYGIREAREDPELKARIKELELRFVEEFGSVLPEGLKLTSVSMKSVIKDIGETLGGVRKESPGLTVISLDPFIAKHGHISLDMTRRFDPETETIQLMHRAGSPTTEQQMSRLLDFLSDGKRRSRDVVLADISGVSGSTITAIVSLLEKHGVTVKTVVLGISSEEVVNRLADEHGDRIKVHVAMFAHRAIELRDLVGIDGKEVPNGNNHRSFVPVTEHPEVAEVRRDRAGEFIRLSDAYKTEVYGELDRRGIDTRRIGEPTQLHEKHRRILIH